MTDVRPAPEPVKTPTLRIHRTMAVDEAAGTLECVHCGTVPIHWKTSRGRKWPVCSIGRREQRRTLGERQRWRMRPKAHGMTISEAAAFRMGKQCAICGATEPLNVDHCHKTGRVRGVLCSNRNRALGMLKDDPARAIAAAAYLQG